MLLLNNCKIFQFKIHQPTDIQYSQNNIDSHKIFDVTDMKIIIMHVIILIVFSRDLVFYFLFFEK